MSAHRPHGHVPMRARGFTLLEIIVVVLVFSVVAAMAYGGLNSVLKTRRAIEDSMARTAEFQRAYLRLRGDFQNLRDRATRDAFGDLQAAFVLDREGRLMLVRGGWRSPLAGGRSSLERVDYRVHEGALKRASYRALDLPQQAEPSELVLLQGVDAVRWRFLDLRNEWQTQWPPQDMALDAGSLASQPPPKAVELTLETRDWGELTVLFRTPQAGLAEGDNAERSSRLITREGLLPAEQFGISAGGGTSTPAPQTIAPVTTPETPPPDAGGAS